jgi:succinoglycan biosynthesis protein ExoA
MAEQASSRSSEPQRQADVSVLTPVLNEERHIRDVVAAMQEQEHEGEIEFLFMDGRSEDRTRAILEELQHEDPRIKVLDNPQRTTAAGLNVGLAAAQGRYVVRMDGHTYYPANYISDAVRRLERGDVAWVAGPQVPRGDGTWSNRVAMALGTWLGRGPSNRWGADEAREDDWFEFELDTGVFTGVWHRSTLDALGGWDPDWPINQDSELAARVQQDGGTIVCLPRLGAEYVPRDSLKALGRQYFRYGLYRAKTARRHPETLRRGNLLNPGVTVTVIAAAVPVRLISRPARLALGLYVSVLAATSLKTAGRERPSDAAALPVVFAVMHLSWGAGFFLGVVRFGLPPTASPRALARLALKGEALPGAETPFRRTADDLR